MGRVREIHRLRRRVRVGAPDPSVTSFSGMAAVTELVDRLGMIRLLDAAIGPIKARDRGFTGGQVLVGLACAQLAGEDFLVGLDRYRADAAGQVLAAVPGLASTTAAGLARRFGDGQWRAVETGLGNIAAAALDILTAVAPQRAARLSETVTIDLDTTDVEVYGRLKRGVAFNHQGQRVGRPHVATWAETATVLAADLMSGRDDPRPHAAGAAAPRAGRAARLGAGRADPAARRRRLLRRGAGPRRAVRRGGVRHRRPADRPVVADPRRGRRDRLDRRDRHDRRAGRGGRVLPGLVAGGDPAADPPGPPRRRPTERCRRIRGPGAAAPCTPTSGCCRSTSSPRPTRSTATRSS